MLKVTVSYLGDGYAHIVIAYTLNDMLHVEGTVAEEDDLLEIVDRFEKVLGRKAWLA